jgi:GTP cyclohydrolase-4
MMEDNEHADLQSERTDIDIPIDLVGIEDVEKRIEIQRRDGMYSMNLSINAFIELPGAQRGVHMSRTAESIDECITEHVLSPKETIEEFAMEIVKAMLEKHEYSCKAVVDMEGPFIIQSRPREGEASSQAAYFIRCHVAGTRPGNDTYEGTGEPQPGESTFDIRISASAEGMIACPCGQQMSREFAKELLLNRDDMALEEGTIDTILNIIPVATHNQRATGTITLQVPVAGAVDVMDLVDAIELGMSGRISGVLKRPDEARLIRIAHQDPLFTEDVLRRIATTMAGDQFKDLPGDMEVTIRVVSQESIHPHQATATTTTTIGRLRDAAMHVQYSCASS